MSTNNYPLGEANQSDRITAFFNNQNDAYRALTELKQEGFSNEQIGLAALDGGGNSTDGPDNASLRLRPDEGINQPRIDTNVSDPKDTIVSEPNNSSLRMRPDEGEAETHPHSFWQNVKNFFSGESQDEATDLDATNLNWSDERASYYSRGLDSGGAIVTVTGGNRENARQILEQCGGDLRESGFESFVEGEQTPRIFRSAASEIGTRFGTGTSDPDVVENEQRRIQLRGELLRAHQERLDRGESEIPRTRKPAA